MVFPNRAEEIPMKATECIRVGTRAKSVAALAPSLTNETFTGSGEKILSIL